jgi:sulfite reductase (NADPH) flavoprotein alpha-component
MYIQDMASNGPAAESKMTILSAQAQSSRRPFGRYLLSSIAGPTYVTAQTLIQQVAYTLSDKLFTYSPDTFDLDIAAKEWSAAREANAHGYATAVHPMQIRSGAGSIALGYMFSRDFDLKKRHIPQGVLATSSSLQFLRPALDQLSLLYSVANPFVAHIAAVEYDDGLATEYITPMEIAEELGFGLLTSQSAYESQHMALLSTLLARDLPMLHVYDGVKISREITRVIDVLDKSGLSATYQSIIKATTTDERKHLSIEGKTLQTIKALNEELGTDYKCFEYFGHPAAESVLVCFGSVEASLGSQVATALAQSGSKFGVINVRVYRPFIEEEFVKLVPKSAKVIGVLGQVQDAQAVQEAGVHSPLYEDVLAALTYTGSLNSPVVQELKYPPSEVWTPGRIAEVLQTLQGNSGSQQSAQLSLNLLEDSVQQYTFWNTDDSTTASAASLLAQALAKDSSQNVTIHTSHDNLIQGGVQRTDIRKSPKSLDLPCPITKANTAIVSEIKIFEQIDILNSVRDGGKLILILPSVKDEDVEKKLPVALKKTISQRGISLYLIDPASATVCGDSPDLESLLLQTAFLRVTLGKYEETGLQKLAAVGSDIHTLEKVAADLEKTLRQIEIPKSWAEEDNGKDEQILPTDISSNSFTTFDKTEEEPPSLLRDWQNIAKGLLFKEVYGTKPSLRPDLTQKTYTVRVKENRRLTPVTYDRNIFHIEFDLGDSGLKYDIGEALGIHAENDHEQVMEFIKWYGLDPEEVVEVASRDDPSVFENRTVYQSLKQNVDIFGRPPKKFYESLAEFARDDVQKKKLLTLAGPEGFKEFQHRAEVDTVTYADLLLEFSSAHPSFHDIVRIVAPMKRREYSIASCQAVTPTSIALMVVVVGWVDTQGRNRFGQATQYLANLPIGAPVTVSVKPSVMKLPPKSTQPLIMAGLGTGLAPFRAFVQHRAMEKAQGKEIGEVLLYMGSRHQREEYCYGEEWEAYQAAGVITLLGRAFSRDQPQKIYIQDRMRQTMDSIVQAYIKKEGAFYLCGPTWPVPDVTAVLEEAIARDARTGGKATGKKVDTAKEIMKLKEEGRYVLEVY